MINKLVLNTFFFVQYNHLQALAYLVPQRCHLPALTLCKLFLISHLMLRLLKCRLRGGLCLLVHRLRRSLNSSHSAIRGSSCLHHHFLLLLLVFLLSALLLGSCQPGHVILSTTLVARLVGASHLFEQIVQIVVHIGRLFLVCFHHFTSFKYIYPNHF